MAQHTTADERFETAKQQAAHMRPAEVFFKGPADLAPQAQLRETYAQELRRKAQEQGRELRDRVPTQERDRDRSDDLER